MMVVIAVMAILLTLTVVSISAYQADARDNERAQKANIIARGLEQYYSDTSLGAGKYPDLTIAASIVASSTLPGIETSNYYFSFNSSTPAFMAATGLTGTTAVTDASPAAQTTTSNIVYLPMTYSTTNSRWEPCDSGESCSRYVLLYKTEKGSTTVTVRSRQQQ